MRAYVQTVTRVLHLPVGVDGVRRDRSGRYRGRRSTFVPVDEELAVRGLSRAA
jgi:hypothetical protein